MLVEPLSPPAARKLIQEIVAAGRTVVSRHALDEMAKDGVFATTNELAILAHVLGIAIAVVSAYHGDDDVVYEVYNEEAEHAVFLYNSGYHFEPLLPLARLQALRAAGVHFAGKLRSYF